MYDTLNSFVMSSETSRLMPSEVNFWDLLDNEAFEYAYDGNGPLPDCQNWADVVDKFLGFTVVKQYPVAWDASGCFILERCQCCSCNALKAFDYLALLNLHYKRSIIVGIRDAGAYLQFHTLVRPMLMLQTEKRFGNEGEKGIWDRGREWKEVRKSIASRKS